MSGRQIKFRNWIPALVAIPFMACGGDGGSGITNPLDGLTTPSAACLAIEAKVGGFLKSTATLTALATSLDVEVKGACAAIAGMEMSDDLTTPAACDAATAVIKAKIDAGVTIRYSPPVCTVNAEAQFGCEADCYAKADVTCSPGTVDVRCKPGELSASCEGSCDVDAYCEGSVDVAVNCEGTCSGSCTGVCSGECKGECTVTANAVCTGMCKGTCDGTCSALNSDGECEGECDGTCDGECSAEVSGMCDGTCSGSCEAECMGTCNGSCEIKAMGGIDCGVDAQCRGGCSGEISAPSCTGTLEPPECMAEAELDCSGSCEGSASLEASCSEPLIEIVGDVDGMVEFEAAIRAQLPVLIKVIGKAELGATVTVDLLAAGVSLVDTAPAECVLSLGTDLVADFSAAASASVNAVTSVEASLSVSVEVSASATASAS